MSGLSDDFVLFYHIIIDENVCTIIGVMNTSISADASSIVMAHISSTATSSVIFSKYFVDMSWFIIATDSIPPASPPTKYPDISGIPCIQNLSIVIIPVYAAPIIVRLVAAPIIVNCVFAKLPIAVPSTDAFHVSMNSAPTPYISENSIADISTFMLLMNISIDSFPVGIVACPVIFVFISPIVLVCSENIVVPVACGSMKFHVANAHTIPRNSVVNSIIVSLCFFHIDISSSFVSILFSSFIVRV